MPPSGYNSKQSNSIVEFLDSVTKSLIEEGKNFNLSAKESLMREINNIDEIVSSGTFNMSSHYVLGLTSEYYKRILKQKPSDFDDIKVYSQNILSEIRQEILAIHVPSIAN